MALKYWEGRNKLTYEPNDLALPKGLGNNAAFSEGIIEINDAVEGTAEDLKGNRLSAAASLSVPSSWL